MQLKAKLKPNILKGMIFLATVFSADLIIGTILEKLYKTQKYGDDYNTLFAIEKATPETLIIGSSRAENIFDPSIFKDELNTKTFNAGRGGQSIFYHYVILKAVLNRYTPKIVVLSMDRKDFAIDKTDYDKLSDLLPFYRDHPEIRVILNLKSPFEKIKMMSSIYPYNSLVFPILRGHLVNETRVKFNGYKPLAKTITQSRPKINYDTYSKLDSIKINTYKKLISECKKAGVELFIVCPPYMVEATGTDQSIVIAKKIAADYQVPFFDASEDPEYISLKEYFADFRHLNETGSMVFSREMAQKIKKILENLN